MTFRLKVEKNDGLDETCTFETDTRYEFACVMELLGMKVFGREMMARLREEARP